MNYEELLESQRFSDFLPTKNSHRIFNLVGHDNIEGGQMRIVIDASPERLASITYYDGIGNLIYPPAYIDVNRITQYILGVSNENDINDIVIKGPKDYTQHILEELQTYFTTVHFKLEY